MKLLNFQSGTGGTSLFGVVIKGHAVSFKTLLQKSGQTRGELSDVYSYLENLPSSEDAARELLKYGEANISSLNAEEKITLEKVRIALEMVGLVLELVQKPADRQPELAAHLGQKSALLAHCFLTDL